MIVGVKIGIGEFLDGMDKEHTHQGKVLLVIPAGCGQKEMVCVKLCTPSRYTGSEVNG